MTTATATATAPVGTAGRRVKVTFPDGTTGEFNTKVDAAYVIGRYRDDLPADSAWAEYAGTWSILTSSRSLEAAIKRAGSNQPVAANHYMTRDLFSEVTFVEVQEAQESDEADAEATAPEGEVTPEEAAEELARRAHNRKARKDDSLARREATSEAAFALGAKELKAIVEG